MTEQLDRYQEKRDFDRTPEPRGTARRRSNGKLRFVVQKHDARRLHYDFRLEHEGVLKSWAVPKEPTEDPKARRLAVQTEDHPLEYGSFEGQIPRHQYGAGTVEIWDSGHWIPLDDPAQGLKNGKLDFELHGERMHGRWTLVRMAERATQSKATAKENWLLIKRSDPRPNGDTTKPRNPERADARASARSGDTNAVTNAKHRGPLVDSRPQDKAVKLTHPERVLFPDPGITKLELARYWEAVAEFALPFMQHRPLMLRRCPGGYDANCFYQKHVGDSVSKVVPRVVIDEGEDPYAMVDSVAALQGLVQIGVLEMHAWGSRAENLEQPDIVVFDLDPAEDLSWKAVVDAAMDLEARLRKVGLEPFARLTGGKGLHLVVPIVQGPSWPAVKRFAQTIAQEIAREHPKHFTASASKSEREGKIYIDYLRNAREATAITSYSPRARAGAPVAMPIALDDLERDASSPPRFLLRDVRRHLARRKRDPWQGFEEARRKLPLTPAE